jgi:hypothetical protein
MSRGAKFLVGLLVLLLVLAGGGYALDRYVHARTEASLEQELTTSFPEVTGDVDVSIGGLLFLPQVVAGSMDDVVMTAGGATFGSVEVTDVDVRARGLSTSEPYTAESIDLTATAPVETLQVALDASDLPDGVTVDVRDGRLTAEASFLGLPVQVELEPQPRPRAIGLSLTTFSLAGATVDAQDLPTSLLDALGGIEIPLGEVLEGMELTAVDVVDGGVRLSVHGTDVVLEQV